MYNIEITTTGIDARKNTKSDEIAFKASCACVVDFNNLHRYRIRAKVSTKQEFKNPKICRDSTLGAGGVVSFAFILECIRCRGPLLPRDGKN